MTPAFLSLMTFFAKRSLLKEDEKVFHPLTFATAVASLIACFVVSSVPIPMMAVWSKTLSLTTAEIAMTVVSYFGGCVATLLFFARLSNFFGRKPVVFLALLFGASASLCFSFAQTASLLYVGRLLQGLSCGFASSAAMSWVVDSAPKEKAWLGTALTAAGPNIGLSIGTLLAGVILAENWLAPSHLFDATVALLLVVACFVVLSKETMRFGTEALGSVLLPKIAMPRRLLRIFGVSAAGFVGTWGLGSFFQGFAAQLSELVFGGADALYASVTYLLLILPNACAGVLIGRFAPHRVIPIVITLFFLAGTTVFGAIALGSAPLFMASVAIVGACSGATCSSSLKFLLVDATLRERAGVISALYLSAYVGSGLPNFVVGLSGEGATMQAISIGYVLWIAATWVIVAGGLLCVKRTASASEALRFKD